MRLSFPNEPFLPWKSTLNPKSQYPTDFVEPWCFSHWPGKQSAHWLTSNYITNILVFIRFDDKYRG
jgi:hypothetical protein